MFAAIVEDDAGSRNEIGDGAGHEHLTRLRECTDTRCDVDRETGKVTASYLALSCVQSGPDVQAKSAGGGRYLQRAPGRSRWTVKTGQEAVAGRVDLLAAEASQLVTNGSVVRVKKGAPTPVSRSREIGSSTSRRSALATPGPNRT